MTDPAAVPASRAVAPAPVLYTEDDENDAFLMRHAFNRSGVSRPLVILTDGQQTIDYLSGAGEFAERERFPLPALLVLDLNLPLLSGFDVLAWVRQQPQLAKLNVVVLSSSNHQKDMDRAHALGANAYFVKPSDVAKRVEFVRTLQERWP